MFVNSIKNSIRQALTELVDEGLISQLIRKVAAELSAQGLVVGKDAKDLLSNAKISYNLETKTIQIEFHKEF